MPLTADQLRDWASVQPDEAYFCEFCLSRLAWNSGDPEKVAQMKKVGRKDELDDLDLPHYYCPNEMCLDKEAYTPAQLADIWGWDEEDVYIPKEGDNDPQT